MPQLDDLLAQIHRPATARCQIDRPDRHLCREAERVSGRGTVRHDGFAALEREGFDGLLDGGRADADTIKPLPDRLITELTADRTLALRDKLATDPSVAFVAVLHKFCQDVFYGGSQYGFAMEVSVRGTTFHSQPEGLRDSVYAKAIEARYDSWRKRLPAKVADLWDGLAALTGPEQAELFAHCASFGVNALYERADRYGGRVSAHSVEQRIAEADRLSLAVGLDMAEAGWRPTVANYLGRVTKPRILEAVREGAGERAAQLIAHLKKGDMATEAERLLAVSGQTVSHPHREGD